MLRVLRYKIHYLLYRKTRFLRCLQQPEVASQNYDANRLEEAQLSQRKSLHAIIHCVRKKNETREHFSVTSTILDQIK